MNIQRFSAIDGFRGLFAFTVLLNHAFNAVSNWTNDVPFKGPHLSVVFFFMISGFVLTHAHGKEEKFSSYFITRILRLWPLVFISTTAMLCIYAFNAKTGGYLPPEDVFSVWLWIQNFSLIHGVFDSDFYVINGPAWSISIELWASLLIPLIFVKMSILVRFIVALLLFSLLAWNSETGLGSSGFYGLYNFIYAVSSMLLGSACYTLFSSKKYFTSYKHIEIFMWVSFFVCMLGIYYQPAHSNRADYFFILSFIPLMGVDFLGERSPIKKMMSSNIFQFLGYISFPLYLLHFPLLITGIMYQGNESPYTAILMFVSISIFISYIYASLVDVRLYKYLKGKVLLPPSKREN